MPPNPPLTLSDWPALLLLVFVGAVASGINAVAGGGTLISFPVLVRLGVPELPANATNSVALWPGSLAGAFGFLPQLKKTGRYLRTLLLPTFLGAVAGAVLLLSTSERSFQIAVPVLILFATVLLAFQPQLKAFAKQPGRHIGPAAGVVFQFLISVYGGYFGAGMGILMLAYLGLMVEGDLHELNALKTWLGLVINLVASALFVGKGLVQLWPAVALTIGSILGGYGAAVFSQRANPDKLRKAIVVYGFLMSGWFAYRAFA